MKEIITPHLAEVNVGHRSILPTGRLKIECGILQQEVEVIVHRGPIIIKCILFGNEEHKEFQIGIYKIWLAVPIEFVRQIKSGQVLLPLSSPCVNQKNMGLPFGR